MERLLRDARHGARLLRHSPGFTLAATAALALGIGAATAIFSVVDAVLVRPLAFREPGRLAVLWEKNPAKNTFKGFISPANFLAWRAQSRAFEGIAGVQSARMNLTGGPRGAIEPEEIEVERVSASLPSLLGVEPVAGRSFRAEEERPGGDTAVLLGYSLWRRRFGGDLAIVGRRIRLRNQSYEVAGVMPAGFALLNPRVEAWLPLALAPGDPRGGSTRNLLAVGRLAPGISLAQAAAEMDGVGAAAERADPKNNAGWRPSVFDLREEVVGSVRTPLLVLMSAVGLLLLMACANVANLLLARAAGRRKEIAVRAALGADRGRLIAQMLTESVLLALLGGAAGAALAGAGVAALRALAPAGIPRLAQAVIDWRVLLFALACSVATGILFGLAPAFSGSRADLRDALQEGGRGGTAGRGRQRLRDVLAAAEIGIAVVVLIGAGLLLRSFLRLRSVHPGFAAERLLTARVPLAGGRNAAEPRRIAFFQELASQTAAIPGVRAVGAVNALPLTGFGIGATFAVEGRPAPPPEDRPTCLMRSATAGYFGVMGIPLRAGRDFAAFDTKDSPPVAIVNATLARRFFDGANPVGARIALDSPARTVEIVGLVGDVKPVRLDAPDWPTIYLPYPQAPAATMTLAVRAGGDPAHLAKSLAAAVRRLDPEQPLSDLRTMESVIGESVAAPRFNALLLGVFAAAAFALAAVGVFGVISCGVTERTHEFGIRLALGAEPGGIAALVLRRGAALASAGLAIGLAPAYCAARLLATLLYEIDAADTATYAAVAGALAATALAASWLPARRAASVEPVAALRHE